ncbi:MAG: DUF2793 domain-containing protein [Erythrobacter sp.]
MPAGQAQKEFFINEALSILDALQPRAVTASQSAPPASPADGECFRVTAPASGAWSGRADCLAVRVAGDWHFINPALGMAIYDRAGDHLLVYRSVWKLAQTPALPSAGSTVDAEARATLTALVEALQSLGILATATP